MSKLEGGVFFVQEEPPKKCHFCGKIKETRPYGPNGEYGCYNCLTSPKRIETTNKKFKELMNKANRIVLIEGSNQ